MTMYSRSAASNEADFTGDFRLRGGYANSVVTIRVILVRRRLYTSFLAKARGKFLLSTRACLYRVLYSHFVVGESEKAVL